MYDIIGDIHGHADKLTQLLAKLGYAPEGGVWRHPTRKVIFLGDFVDRGPQQIETVTIAKNMVEQGEALAVMGNHEYNAVAWATPDPQAPDQALRVHNDKHQRQHQAFLDQVGEGSQLHQDFIAWFKTLPLYLDLPQLRAIHACWHAPLLKTVAPYLDTQNRLLPHAWEAGAREGTELHEALETLLKGLEMALPEGYSFEDKDGNVRTDVRTKWWKTGSKTYRNLALMPAKDLNTIPDIPVDGRLPTYDQQKPVFVGHYWLQGEPAPLTDHIACLDYSVAGDNSGKLCAYRLGDETTLTKAHFVYVSSTR